MSGMVTINKTHCAFADGDTTWVAMVRSACTNHCAHQTASVPKVQKDAVLIRVYQPAIRRHKHTPRLPKWNPFLCAPSRRSSSPGVFVPSARLASPSVLSSGLGSFGVDSCRGIIPVPAAL
ncbi:hypothetical protein DPMN_140003 [Dreissena polymorpha]|uniref:Uncharacterized protein n=1 Tax=Dreissena polymorpha TaxID=45954 RepID=A0A9D4JJZ1_DREPO|nr:hypothetical protein DPMN_140003 [Dreissena polymorpha]